MEEKGTKGRYVSIERIQEVENGKVEWIMATSSTPGGSIPKFITESSMPGQIAAVSSCSIHILSSGIYDADFTLYKDVPHFLKWLHSNRDKAPAQS